MSRNHSSHVALAVLLLAGCARAPELEESSGVAVPSAAAAAGAVAEDPADVTPDLVVDVSELAAQTPPPVICRELLKQGSNVIVRQCMTAANWKRFERRQEAEAQEIVRMLQSGQAR